MINRQILREKFGDMLGPNNSLDIINGRRTFVIIVVQRMENPK